MSEDSQHGWFHCGACGALHPGAAGASQPPACPECGQEPPAVAADSGTAAAVAPESSPHAGMIRKKRRVRRPDAPASSRKRRRGSRKKARLLVVWVCVWVALIVAMAVIMRIVYPQKVVQQLATAEDAFVESNEDQVLLRDNLKEAATVFKKFLENTAPEIRAGQVLRPAVSVARMARFQSMNVETSYDGEAKILARQVIRPPSGAGMEAWWTLDSGRVVETVFFQEDGHWKLDWDHYVRFSSQPWSLFLAGTGADQGEFRLLARQRADTGTLRSDQFGIVLSAAQPGHPGETGSSSPTIVIDRASEIGKRLQAAFDDRAKGLGAFGSTGVTRDPFDQIRVRVKVSRLEGDERSFRIDELLACHWLELTDAGGDLPVSTR